MCRCSVPTAFSMVGMERRYVWKCVGFCCRILAKLEMKQIGRHYYSSHMPVKIPQHKWVTVQSMTSHTHAHTHAWHTWHTHCTHTHTQHTHGTHTHTHTAHTHTHTHTPLVQLLSVQSSLHCTPLDPPMPCFCEISCFETLRCKIRTSDNWKALAA